MLSRVALSSGILLTALLVHAVGWTWLVMLAVAGSALRSLSRLMFGGPRQP